MKFVIYILTCLLTITAISCQTFSVQQSNKISNSEKNQSHIENYRVDTSANFQQYSYFIGHNIASDIKSKGSIDSLDLKMFNLAFKDVYHNDTNRLSTERSEEILKYLTDSMRKRQIENQAKQFLPNKKSGEAFFASLKKDTNIVFTSSGLAYKINRVGTGVFPKETDEVSVFYEGKLINGKIFDTSYGGENPVKLNLSGVIPGWTEGLQLIAEGGEIELYIPYNLAYGEKGQAPRIEPFSSLIFKVELIQVTASQNNDEHKGHDHGPGGHHH
tara:strand:+ start:653 stop:1471 length:819 start_codon:yes stop_codon:yes gene_type:complete